MDVDVKVGGRSVALEVGIPVGLAVALRFGVGVGVPCGRVVSFPPVLTEVATVSRLLLTGTAAKPVWSGTPIASSRITCVISMAARATAASAITTNVGFSLDERNYRALLYTG